VGNGLRFCPVYGHAEGKSQHAPSQRSPQDGCFHSHPVLSDPGNSCQIAVKRQASNRKRKIRIYKAVKLDVVFYGEFHDGDFNWFDLAHRGK